MSNSSNSRSFEVVFLTPGGEFTTQVDEDEHIWDAAAHAGIVLPALCHNGWCLTCAARLECSGKVDQSDSVAYYPEDRNAGFVLLCTGKPRSNLRVGTHQAAEMRKFRLRNKLPAPYSYGLVP